MGVLPALRLAEPRDARGIAEMSRDFIEYGLGWRWTETRVLRALQDEATNVVVVPDARGHRAFGIMYYGDTTAHLLLLCVHPEHRGQGLAAYVLRWLEQCAETAGNARIVLEARADNPQALGFYCSLGYGQRGRVPGYYRGRVDAICLEKRLWASHTA